MKITPRRAAAAVLAQQIAFAINNAAFPDVPFDEIQRIAAAMDKIAAPMLKRLESIAGDVTMDDLDDKWGRRY